MSYTETIHSHVSVTVNYSYPASESGGGGSKTVTEPIDITVVVHDEAFQRSAENCNRQLVNVVSSLSRSAEQQIAAKSLASEKISRSVVGGFYDYTKADFSQKVVELENIISSETPKILSYIEQLRAIKDRMEYDFNLIKGRYASIFDSLDEELSREIHRMYVPCFSLIDDSLGKLITESRLESISAVMGYIDLSITQNAILSSYLKERHMATMERISRIAHTMKRLDASLAMLCGNSGGRGSETIYLPAVVFEREKLESLKQFEVTCCFSVSDGTKNQMAESRILDSIMESGVELSSEKDIEIIGMELSNMIDRIDDSRKRKEMQRLLAEYKGEKR